jgi:hypothetical protein
MPPVPFGLLASFGGSFLGDPPGLLGSSFGFRFGAWRRRWCLGEIGQINHGRFLHAFRFIGREHSDQAEDRHVEQDGEEKQVEERIFNVFI